MHMKNIFKSLLFLMAAAAVASCNVDNVGKTFNLDEAGAGASFLQTVVSNTALSAKTTTFNVPVGRNDATSAATYSLKSTLPEGVCPASVSFAAGESEANIVLDLSNLNVGTTCKGAISLVDQPSYCRSSVNLTLAKAYSWTSIGKGQFYDGLALQPDDTDLGIIECEILQADGFNRWRLMNPFPKDKLIAAWAESYVTYTPDSYIEFFLTDEGTIDFASHVVKTGLTYVGLGAEAYIYYYYPSAYSASYAAYDADNVFVMDKVAQFYFAQVIMNTTSWFGMGAKYVSFPGGPDLNELLAE